MELGKCIFNHYYKTVSSGEEGEINGIGLDESSLEASSLFSWHLLPGRPLCVGLSQHPRNCRLRNLS